MIKSYCIFLSGLLFLAPFSLQASWSPSVQSKSEMVLAASPIIQKDFTNRAEKKLLKRWHATHQESFSSTRWGVSYDLIEVITPKTHQFPLPLLPRESLKLEPQAVISRLAVVQVVDKDKVQPKIQTVFVDLSMPYLLEVINQKEKAESSTTEIFVYKILEGSVVRTQLPLNSATSGIIGLSSTSESFWSLLNINPKEFDILRWDAFGRPTIAREINTVTKESKESEEYIYFTYDTEKDIRPQIIQTVALLPENLQKTTTILVNQTTISFEEKSWSRADILKNAVTVFLTP